MKDLISFIQEFEEHNIEVKSCVFRSVNIGFSLDLSLYTDTIFTYIFSNSHKLYWPITGRFDQSSFDGLTNKWHRNDDYVDSSLTLKEAMSHIKRMLA